MEEFSQDKLKIMAALKKDLGGVIGGAAAAKIGGLTAISFKASGSAAIEAKVNINLAAEVSAGAGAGAGAGPGAGGSVCF